MKEITYEYTIDSAVRKAHSGKAIDKMSREEKQERISEILFVLRRNLGFSITISYEEFILKKELRRLTGL